MGARLYLPGLGQFTSTDPIYGGNANAYTYPADPINLSDTSGATVRGDEGGGCDTACNAAIASALSASATASKAVAVVAWKKRRTANRVAHRPNRPPSPAQIAALGITLGAVALALTGVGLVVELGGAATFLVGTAAFAAGTAAAGIDEGPCFNDHVSAACGGLVMGVVGTGVGGGALAADLAGKAALADWLGAASLGYSATGFALDGLSATGLTR